MQKANGDEDYIPQNHGHNSPVPCGGEITNKTPSCSLGFLLRLFACQAGAPSYPCSPISAPSATKLQETRNKMPAASVYIIENLHFLPFLWWIRLRNMLAYV